jgi:endonuclease YncB( thermonuclease family)
MRRFVLRWACPVALGLAAAGSASVVRVAWVTDGDTFVPTNRAHVRLLQIDTPEVGSGECYPRAAARELRRLLPVGATVRLESDPRLDRVDRYGRQLRYAWRGRTNVNCADVRHSDFAVRGSDPPRFASDHDGRGCEG